MADPNRTIVWFRQDLRVQDNPALQAAADRGNAVIPVYIHAPHAEGDWMPGAASRLWLRQSLESLGKDLRQLGSRLIIRRGESLKELRYLIREMQANTVYWNRRYEPAIVERDKVVKSGLASDDIEVASFNGALLYEPWEIETKDGSPYRVFTAFWKACLGSGDPAEPLPAPERLARPRQWPEGVELSDLALEPKVNWDADIRNAWTPGSEGAETRLQEFLDEALRQYSEGRNRPDMDGSSRLSPHLHYGEISPRQVWGAVKGRAALYSSKSSKESARVFLAELGWREFAHHLLYHFPYTTEEPLRDEFARFPWMSDKKGLRAWQRGETGYPIVDAGMRQLWAIGWMHNRVRMIVASFLVKHLLIPWQHGAEWFWDTLVDADLANNTLGWQWTAGCGADAAPYFRIFNPILQGKKYDPNGEYVRQWVPELAPLPTQYIHCPWEAPEGTLADAGIKLGRDYPKPIVDHGEARERALAAFGTIRKT